MWFPFKFDKAVQAAAYLLRREPAHEMSIRRLMALLYCAERESIRQTGRPIIGGRIVAIGKENGACGNEGYRR